MEKSLYETLVENYGSMGIHNAVEFVKTLHPKYPEIPQKPKLPTIKSTPAEHRQYADDLEKYENQMVAYRKEKEKYQTKVNELNGELEKFIKEMSGLNTIPEQYRSKVWSLAWENGHACGYGDVYNHLLDLVDIFK